MTLDMNIEIKVGEASTQAAVAFTQRLLGPIAEATDFLSDKIRFMRWKSAQKTIEEAEKIAIERGIAVKEVPVKFLVPFLEKCSLEEDDSKLIEKWAELLVTAIDDYSHRLICYADILAQLGPEEVNILEAMWNKTNPKVMGTVENIIDIYGGGGATSRNSLSELHSASIDMKSGVDEIGRYLLFQITSVRDSNRGLYTSQTGSYLRENSIFWMEKLGLVKVVSNIDSEVDNFDHFVFKAQLTPLGYSFVKACRGGGKEANNEMQPTSGKHQLI